MPILLIKENTQASIDSGLTTSRILPWNKSFKDLSWAEFYLIQPGVLNKSSSKINSVKDRLSSTSSLPFKAFSTINLKKGFNKVNKKN